MFCFKYLFLMQIAMFLLILYVKPISAQDSLRVLIITAHPDEAEEYAGGTIALFSKSGAAVKVASLSNGDVGHWRMTKEDLAVRRKNEALAAGKILGISSYEILDNHDGELMPDIALRKEVVRIIREWQPDVVITFLEMFAGGHADNMAVAQTVRQGAGLSLAPLFLPEVPVLTKKPVFLVMRDYYSKSFPHKPDFVIPIDKVIELKYKSFAAHASQFFEFAPWQRGLLEEVPKEEKEQRAYFEKYWGEFSTISAEMRNWLAEWYGQAIAEQFTYAEEFEYASNSRHLNREEIIKLFPMLK